MALWAQIAACTDFRLVEGVKATAIGTKSDFGAGDYLI
jgi:hypothetical protein